LCKKAWSLKNPNFALQNSPTLYASNGKWSEVTCKSILCNGRRVIKKGNTCNPNRKWFINSFDAICMHIPDGFLGPSTWIFFWIVMIPIWVIASSKVKKSLKSRQVPLLAIGSAFSFVVMMFIVPVPGGSTGHAVGGGIIAVLLGPWSAVIAVSIALAIQALFFGDGGITMIAVNSFNAAFIMPVASYYIYKMLEIRFSSNQWVAAGIASYAGLNIMAVVTGIILGIQSVLYRAADGKALYFPYPLGISIPAMAVEHLFFFGFIEFAITSLVIKYLHETEPELVNLDGMNKTGQLTPEIS